MMSGELERVKKADIDIQPLKRYYEGKMAPENKRPSQYKQSSRKGKKAWRKNIDISDLENKIEEKQGQEITHGKQDLEAVHDKELFHIDIDGDEVLKQKLVKRKQIKKNLKSSEILESIKSQSKVPALLNPKVKNKKNEKIQGVSKKELNKLLGLAGRKLGESKLKARAAKEGLVKSGAFDLWNNDSVEEVKIPSNIKINVKKSQKTKVPEELLKQSTTGWSVATVAPKTISREAEQVKITTDVPHAGKSYNPSKREWSALIDMEFKVEVVNEQRRIELAIYQDKIKHLMETLDNKEEDSDSEDEEGVEENLDTRKAGEDQELLDSRSNRLSINPVTQNKKKTKYQRNKQRRHEEQLKLRKELKDLKARVLELEKIEEVEKELSSKPIPTHSIEGKVRKNKKHKLGTKHSVMEDNLEVKFSDELSDSLRKLKPEGSLIYDSVRKLQSSGKIESRVPIRKGRRHKPKITEKWTYKDFK